MDGLQQIINKCYRVIKPLGNIVSSIGIVLLAAMMFLTAADVLMRYLFNKPIVGSYELIQYMMATAIAMGLAYCAIEKGHVTIDVLLSRLPRRTCAIINSVTGLLSLLIAALITWQSCVYIVKLQQSQLVTQVLLIPVYPFVVIVAFGIAFYFVVLIVHFLEFLAEGLKE